jgi:hypothetical protein
MRLPMWSKREAMWYGAVWHDQCIQTGCKLVNQINLPWGRKEVRDYRCCNKAIFGWIYFQHALKWSFRRTLAYHQRMSNIWPARCRTRRAGLKVNAEKSKFCTGENEYLGWITETVSKPLPIRFNNDYEDYEPTNRKQTHVVSLV